MSDITIVVNGTPRPLAADAAGYALLWWLREDCGLVGTRFGCGQGACGACTVHLDGQPVRACVVPCAAAAGRRVTSVEGLAAGDGAPHAVQRAWAELGVPQCGYCQNGQMMAAAALIVAHPRPTDAQIDAAMVGNLCRCGTYDRIRAAVRRAGELASAAR